MLALTGLLLALVLLSFVGPGQARPADEPVAALHASVNGQPSTGDVTTTVVMPDERVDIKTTVTAHPVAADVSPAKAS